MADTAEPVAVALDDATVAFRVAGDRVYTAVEQALSARLNLCNTRLHESPRRRRRRNRSQISIVDV